MIIFIIIITLLSLITDKKYHLAPISHPDSFINNICISMRNRLFNDNNSSYSIIELAYKNKQYTPCNRKGKRIGFIAI